MSRRTPPVRVTREKKMWESACAPAIEIRTHGDPVLQVTPLIGDPEASPAPSWRFTLQTPVLNVANFCPSAPNAFDFLLNYLTAEGGIPRAVKTGFPLETPSSMGSFYPEVMKPDALNAGLMAELLRQIDYDEGTSAACSDSRYP